MSQQLLEEITKEQTRSDLPELHVGDTVRVANRIVEGNKERIQNYEGVIIRIRGQKTSINMTITVRKVFKGVGVERIFPICSPKVDSIKLIRMGKVRRSKLYYLRDRRGKSARIKEKNMYTKKEKAN